MKIKAEDINKDSVVVYYKWLGLNYHNFYIDGKSIIKIPIHRRLIFPGEPLHIDREKLDWVIEEEDEEDEGYERGSNELIESLTYPDIYERIEEIEGVIVTAIEHYSIYIEKCGLDIFDWQDLAPKVFDVLGEFFKEIYILEEEERAELEMIEKGTRELEILANESSDSNETISNKEKFEEYFKKWQKDKKNDDDCEK